MSQTAAEKATLLQIIADCKAAVRRHDDSSDSDETEVAYGTNRGNKLKRKARQVHAGSLDEPTGKKLTPEVIEYNGRQRMILYRNTGKRDEPEEQRAPGSGRKRKQKANANIEEEGPVDLDPYANIHLETLLAPAVEPKDIPNHPALSIPYKSRHLTDLCDQVLDIICAEHKHLVTIKRLLTHLLGDDPWVSGDKMESVVAPKFIQEAQAMIQERERAKAVASELESQPKETQSTIPDGDIEMLDSARPDEGAEKLPTNEVPAKSPIPKVEHPSPPDGFAEAAGESSSTAQNRLPQNPPAAVTNDDPNVMQIIDGTTSAPAGLPAGVDPYEIINCTSPWFYPPARDEDARNFGLPPQEAEETRQLLLLAVQKEEEFIRGLERVRAMLLKADRQRKDVWNWCRADGAPDLSDGEDYVDLEYWGLKEGDLVKGAEEEEEEDPKGKKTARTSRRN
ncbi:hypothetical protein TWF173_001770 [Orbilia oligospora]|uniref:Transcriptional regulatory protein RXT2 N-terminal domain-containing protein n=2 Tax=Orbilia oligospora TaxID=2813651 RepID=G1XAI1_ARTOA|nr:hypothetical protein AOL_s00076g639 [Orbilia oligospora ATCC 24927]EGX49841.1 hypothetical protein AOL_s00076g639 [Orbilia oligospora ATCC 24927]KAF3273770.1 hypothetical protein TWF970_008366 [Orbilia oligospora]KAF3316478.1 hypothetical protein TWF173_001770 [Orbilia oligospora]